MGSIKAYLNGDGQNIDHNYEYFVVFVLFSLFLPLRVCVCVFFGRTSFYYLLLLPYGS